MSTIQIRKTGITHLQTDAIVNAANENLMTGSGVCDAIFYAAGPNELQAACNQIGHCNTGSAVITPGFRLSNKYIIHAVGPVWRGGSQEEEKLLYSAYQQSLLLAVQYGCKSVGFPLISTGVYGYPVELAWPTAIQACTDFQLEHPDSPIDIYFAVIDDRAISIGNKILSRQKTEKTILFLSKLSEEGLESLKDKICSEGSKLIDAKAQPVACKLFEVLCNQRILIQMNADQLTQSLEAIFPEAVIAEGWAGKYCDMLLKVLDEVRIGMPQTNERAKIYEKHLRETLVPNLKKGAQSGTVLDDLEPLTDIYKTLACLLRTCKKRESKFAFEVTREDLDQLNEAVRNIRGTGTGVLGMSLFTIPVSQDERQYATLLSWILEEYLSDQEGIERGTNQ